MRVPTLLIALALAALSPRAGAAQAGPAEAEARLAQAWAQVHPGQAAPPPCAHRDPVRLVAGEADPAPGQEQVLASRRYGVALLSAAGRPLAWAAIGCGDTRYADERQFPAVEEVRLVRASGLAPADVLLRTSDLGHCGGGSEYLLLRRDGDRLVPLARLPAALSVSCGGNPGEEWEAQVAVPAPGVLQVVTTGRARRGPFDAPGPWTPIRRTETYRLRGDRFVKDEGPSGGTQLGGAGRRQSL